MACEERLHGEIKERTETNYITWNIPQNINVAAHLRGMRPAPTNKKDTLMLRKNSNTNTINQTLN